MANAVLYNQGSHPTGALKSGTMSMNVSPSLDIGALKWRNGYENNNMWVIYSDTYSQGQATQGNSLPTIWATSIFTDSGLVNLINTLPARAGQTPFTDVTAATSWLRGQGVYFLSNQNYPQIVTSGLTMMLDGGFSASFPSGTGTTWYDVCGNDKNATLYNGTNWVNSGVTSYLSFDGTNDYVANNDFYTSSYFTTNQSWTITTTINIISAPGNGGVFANQKYQTESNAGGFGLNLQSSKYCINLTYNDGSGNQTSYESLVYTNIGFGKIEHITAVYRAETSTVSIYRNGVLETSSTNANYKWSPRSSGIANYIGASTQGGWGNFYPMNIYNIFLHNRALSSSEILQNYYKGPIVTSGLTIMLDAGNVISYSGTGTTWKDLTTNGNNMSMVNGMVYNQTNGGELYMDGGDEYLQIPPSTNLDNLFSANSFTITVIAKSDNVVYPRSRCPIYVNGTVTNYSSGGPRTGWSAGHGASTTSMEIRCGDGTNFNSGYISHTVQESTVYHRTFVIDRTNGVKTSYYVNGVLQGSLDFTNITGSIYTGTGSDFVDGFVFGYVWGWRFIGGVYNIMVHNRALSANEVQQNFNAQRGRFGI